MLLRILFACVLLLATNAANGDEGVEWIFDGELVRVSMKKSNDYWYSIPLKAQDIWKSKFNEDIFRKSGPNKYILDVTYLSGTRRCQDLESEAVTNFGKTHYPLLSTFDGLIEIKISQIIPVRNTAFSASLPIRRLDKYKVNWPDCESIEEEVALSAFGLLRLLLLHKSGQATQEQLDSYLAAMNKVIEPEKTLYDAYESLVKFVVFPVVAVIHMGKESVGTVLDNADIVSSALHSTNLTLTNTIAGITTGAHRLDNFETNSMEGPGNKIHGENFYDIPFFFNDEAQDKWCGSSMAQLGFTNKVLFDKAKREVCGDNTGKSKTSKSKSK